MSFSIIDWNDRASTLGLQPRVDVQSFQSMIEKDKPLLRNGPLSQHVNHRSGWTWAKLTHCWHVHCYHHMSVSEKWSPNGHVHTKIYDVRFCEPYFQSYFKKKKQLIAAQFLATKTRGLSRLLRCPQR